MKNPIRRQSIVIITLLSLIILLIIGLALTNPTISDFKSYTNSIGFNSDYKIRTGNFLSFQHTSAGTIVTSEFLKIHFDQIARTIMFHDITL